MEQQDIPEGLTPEMLLRTYAAGLFPMAESRDDPALYFVEPRHRGLILLDRFHVPRRLRRIVRSRAFTVTFNRQFPAVVRECAAHTETRPETWISDRIIALYCALHRNGHGHSVECWKDGWLVGGIYGVSLKGAFFGESMYSRYTNASKVALVHLVARLVGAGFIFLDTQFVTDHLAQFGTIAVERSEYQSLLSKALEHDADILREPTPNDLEAVMRNADT